MANPHSLLLTPKIETSIDWTSIYSNTLYPLHVDVGCARGRFLVNLANKAPKQVWNHLGVEIRPDIVKESLVSLHKDQKAGVTQQNIHFMAFNFAVSAEDFFRTLPVETVRLVSFQFPDPWRKKKYLSRRIIQPDLLDTIAQYLYMRGFIYVSSDSRHLAIHMKSVLLGHDRFQMMEEDPLQTESVRAEWLQGGLSLSAGSTSSEVKRDCSEAEVIEEEVGDDLDGEVLEDDGRGWLSFNPLGEPSERELVCEKTWKPVWRLVFQKIR
jgi:tRNA (guanine-N7-)-methyltransferase